MNNYETVILAGGRAPWLKAIAGTDIRTLAKVGDKHLLTYLMDSLHASGRVDKIYVASDKAALAELEAAGLTGFTPVCTDNMSLAEASLTAANVIEAEQPENHRIFFVCDDIPMLSPAAINDFLDQCEAAPEGAVFFAAIPKEDCLAQYPEGKRTYVHLADGRFTGGNVMINWYPAIPRCQEIAHFLFVHRKHPFKLVTVLGWGFFLKALIGRLTVQDIEKRCTELLKFNCKAIITHHACVGMDMDKPEDWEVVKKQLTRQG